MNDVRPEAGRPIPPPVPLKVSVRHLQEMAGLVRYAWYQGWLHSNDCVRALYALSACDAAGNVWTIGIQTGRWYRRTTDSWMRDEPEGPLLVALTEDAFSQLCRETATCAKGDLMGDSSPLDRPSAAPCGPGRPRQGNNNVTSGASEPRAAFCIHCGARLNPNGRFCGRCGTRRK